MYRKLTYLTLSGIQSILILHPYTYAEWVIYVDKVARFYIAAYNEEHASNNRILNLLDSGITIEQILSQISQATEQRVHLGELPFFRIRISSGVNTSELEPLPMEWLEMIETKI